MLQIGFDLTNGIAKKRENNKNKRMSQNDVSNKKEKRRIPICNDNYCSMEKLSFVPHFPIS